MIGHGCMIGGDAVAWKGIQLIGRMPIIGERRVVDVTDGLIHRWRLTENANDAVGALGLTNNGTVAFSMDGASFNGSTQYLSGTLSLPTSGTLSLWIRPSAFGNRNPGGWGTNGGGYGFTGFSSNTSNILYAYYKYSALALSGKTYCEADFPSASYTNVTVTWNGAALKTYVGGEQLTGNVSVGGVNSVYFAIGSMGTYGSGRFAGCIKDARVYEVELSGAQIELLAANGPNP